MRYAIRSWCLLRRYTGSLLALYRPIVASVRLVQEGVELMPNDNVSIRALAVEYNQMNVPRLFDGTS